MQKIDLENKTLFVTGAAGFIGSNLVKRLLKDTTTARIIGIDNMNDYYDPALKEFRLKELQDERFVFIKGDIADRNAIEAIFNDYQPAVVVNLAAQAGVRYSITTPDAYIQSLLICSPYLVITSTGTLKILATFRIVSIQRPDAAAI